MENKRVVITGLGAITPIGNGKTGLLEGLKKGLSGIRRIASFDPSQFRSQIAAEIKDFNPLDYLVTKRLKRLDRFAQISLAAGKLALEDAGVIASEAKQSHALNLLKDHSEEVGISMGSALGGVAFAEVQHNIFLKEGIRHIDPSLALLVFGGSSSCNMAIEFGITGPATTNSNSCASGTIAVGDGFRMIKHGQAAMILAGGAEVAISPLCFGAFDLIKSMSTRNDSPEKACRPFDRNRDGFIMGEGSAVLVLEELNHAIERGANIYAEVLGYGLTNDAYHMTAPRPDAACAIRTMKLALKEASIDPSLIDYINAHASSTPLNDKTETLAIKSVFNTHAYKLAVSGTKPFYGHALGASGAIEAAICCLALAYDYLPPTLNLEDPDPECDLDYIPKEGRNKRINYALSNSFGFGGINASLVLGRY